jgi:hypothetical protein
MHTIIIVKGHIFKADTAFNIFKLYAIFLIYNIRLRIHNFQESFKACHSTLELFSKINKSPYRH